MFETHIQNIKLKYSMFHIMKIKRKIEEILSYLKYYFIRIQTTSII